MSFVGPWIPTKGTCRKCNRSRLKYIVWESSDGAHEDYKYECDYCGYYWWVDGIDY